MNKPKIILIGAGGHAHACIDVIEQQDQFSIGGLVGIPEEMHSRHLGYSVIATDGDLEQLIWNVPEIIADLSKMVELAPGDIIMTGTPAGVAACVAGDKLECSVEGIGTVSVTIGPALA